MFYLSLSPESSGGMAPKRMKKKITVLLVDDHALVRRGFQLIVEEEADMKIVGEAGDGVEAVEMARRLRPTVVLMITRCRE